MGITGNGKGVLAIWLDAAPGSDGILGEWLNREHHCERVDVPGFLSARRYQAVQGSPRYFICYGARDAAVLGSAPYLERLNNPTPWTQRAMPNFRNTVRSACQVRHRLGRGEGGTLGLWRLAPAPGHAAQLLDWLLTGGLQAAQEQPGIVSAEVWQAEVAASTLPSKEKEIRGEDGQVDWVLAVTGNHPEELAALHAGVLSPAALTAAGAAPAMEWGCYRQIFALDE